MLGVIKVLRCLTSTMLISMSSARRFSDAHRAHAMTIQD